MKNYSKVALIITVCATSPQLQAQSITQLHRIDATVTNAESVNAQKHLAYCRQNFTLPKEDENIIKDARGYSVSDFSTTDVEGNGTKYAKEHPYSLLKLGKDQCKLIMESASKDCNYYDSRGEHNPHSIPDHLGVNLSLLERRVKNSKVDTPEK